jgi:hypothetical protein
MSEDLIIDEGTEFFGETAFDRVHLENKIKELENKLSQVGRIHEGLMKDKEEEIEKKLEQAEQKVAMVESKLEYLKQAWLDVEDSPLDSTKKLKKGDIIPSVMPDPNYTKRYIDTWRAEDEKMIWKDEFPDIKEKYEVIAVEETTELILPDD